MMTSVNIPSPKINGATLLSGSAGQPTWSTLSAGANITITNASNSITIAATGGGGTGNPQWYGNVTSVTSGATSGTSHPYSLTNLTYSPTADFAYAGAARMSWYTGVQTIGYQGFVFMARPAVGNAYGISGGAATYYGPGAVFVGGNPFVWTNGGTTVTYPLPTISATLSGSSFVATSSGTDQTTPAFTNYKKTIDFAIDLEQATQAF